jgi:hypothetical protein
MDVLVRSAVSWLRGRRSVVVVRLVWSVVIVEVMKRVMYEARNVLVRNAVSWL